ncbi:G-protein coupled receptor moody-like isoform X3 [Penaeus chinensis]|uniref:G-protein coupled receptor moody-like isoform X3 n=1 Tax=Penaeus chinensis TaxID=139456 RepID=UPI001FB5A44B|nr:G-protein coupled receptor moody-like isoform X3 [Penaeus chinensis]
MARQPLSSALGVVTSDFLLYNFTQLFLNPSPSASAMDYTSGMAGVGSLDPEMDIFTSTKLSVATEDDATTQTDEEMNAFMANFTTPLPTLAPDASMAFDGANYPKTMLGFTAACAFIIAVIGTFGNLLTIIALPMSKKLRTTATAFVVNLAVVELLFCVFILPMSGAQYLVLQHTEESLLSNRDCIFFAVTRYTLTQVELQTILAIALTRALAVSLPRLYAIINRPAIMGCYITGIWIYSFLLKMPTAFGLLGHYTFNSHTMECDMSNKNKKSRLIMILIEAVVPVFTIIILYIFVFVMVKLSTARVNRASNRGKVPPAASSTTSASSTSGTNQRKGSNSSFRSLKKMVSESNLRARFVRAARHLNGRRTHQSSTVSQRLSTSRRDMRVARTIFIIFVLVLVCSVPVMMIHTLDRQVKHPVRFLSLHILYWIQYCLNLVVYVLMNRQYRDAYVECLARVFPRFKQHHGRRFFWEKASISSKPPHANTSTRPRLDSAGNLGDSIVSCDGDPPSAAGGQPGAIAPQGRLSAIPEGHSSSAANDSVFSDPHKKDSKDEEAGKRGGEESSGESEDEGEEQRALVDREHWLSKNGSTADRLPESECKV